jgi:hypothetical protein
VLPGPPADPNPTMELNQTQDVVILAPTGEHIDAGLT